MLSRLVIGLMSAAGAAVMSVPGVATADDPPPLPNVNAFAPVKTSEYAVMDNQWYAFSTPDGITCVLQRDGGYGCSGAIPAAPGGANMVSGGTGAPGFASAAAPLFSVVDGAKPLPANTRISYQTVSCGTDGVMTACVDGRNQSGFVISPAGSYVVGDRPSGIKPSVRIG
ncbi:hypothetical protein [Mycobacterium aquaticum]|uniref:Secreted protein n=1 Tax=Mycobacterium aquaticum TaxID=1927124 RepID=A0A1X0B6U8_9MYCO|nr:hypothetical protein [Mycobacterium aquaticum]ORA38054.1 hypothetical protein BST13_05460 [Mycobacterium aquaticum]